MSNRRNSMAPRKSASLFSAQPRSILPGSEKPPVRSTLAGSERPPVDRASAEKPATPSGRVTVSVIVRRKAPLKAAHITGRQRLTRAQFRANHAADPTAVKLVRAFAKEYGLTPEAGTPAPGRRTVKLTGTVA